MSFSDYMCVVNIVCPDSSYYLVMYKQDAEALLKALAGNENISAYIED